MTKYPTIEDGFISEIKRIKHIEVRDGYEAAKAFALRTLCMYHDKIADKDHFARLKEYRGSYIGSICYLEQYVRDVLFNPGELGTGMIMLGGERNDEISSVLHECYP